LIDPTFNSTGGMLRQETLPLRLMAPCLDVLRELSATERDLIRLVVETVQELRDSDDEDAAANAFVSGGSSHFICILNHLTGRS
jgi:hypothetical protein